VLDELDENGNPKGETTDDVPFNLKVHCEHLTNVSLFWRILHRITCQLLLERSALDIASKRPGRWRKAFGTCAPPQDHGQDRGAQSCVQFLVDHARGGRHRERTLNVL